MKYKIKEAILNSRESPLLLGGYGLLLISENQSVVSGIGIHCNRLAAVYFLGQQLLRQIVQQIVLYGTFHRTGAEFRVITCIGKEVYGGICQNKFHTGRNMMVSSIRFKNSGRMVFFSIFITSFLVSSTICSLLLLLSFSIWLWI